MLLQYENIYEPPREKSIKLISILEIHMLK